MSLVHAVHTGKDLVHAVDTGKGLVHAVDRVKGSVPEVHTETGLEHGIETWISWRCREKGDNGAAQYLYCNALASWGCKPRRR